MANNLENIRREFLKYIEISDNEWEAFSSYFSIEELKKRDLLYEYEEVCEYLYFVDKGLLRIYFLQDGEERTFHFALDHYFAVDYESFLRQTPSHYMLEALEDTTVIKVPLQALQYAYQNMEHGEKLGRLLAEEYIFYFTKKIKAIYTKTPLERYKSFNVYFPGIFQRIPQHYIASYLNISSVHLSRLISQENKKEKSN